MLAARAVSASLEDPLSALEVGQVEEPNVPEGWELIEVKAVSLNHHDVWSLRGIGLPEERLPMIIGCDGAGIDDKGNEVVVHAVLGDPDFPGGEIVDPGRTLLSELHPGTLAERVAVPRRNLVPKPESLSFEEACCLPTAWLTAYRMLFDRSGLHPGQTVLIQGAGGGVASAAIALGRAAGFRDQAVGGAAERRVDELDEVAHASACSSQLVVRAPPAKRSARSRSSSSPWFVATPSTTSCSRPCSRIDRASSRSRP